MHNKRTVLAISTALSLFGATSVMAQEAPAAPPAEQVSKAQAEKKDVTEIEGMIVTAQKRPERLLDVPMSITAISGERLVEAGIGSTGDLQQAVPGLTTVNNGLGFVPVIRGVSSQGTSPGDESNVSIYLDDVYIGAPMAGLFDLADIERIEVLKGPQGTLFGRNATGGAIRIVTRRPSFQPQMLLNLDYGFDYNEVKLGAFATGPLSDNLAGSLSLTYRHGDGHIKGIGPNAGRTFGGPDNYLVRGKLLYQPSDTLELMLTADTMSNNNDLITAVSPPKGVNPFPGPGSVPSQPFQFAGSTRPWQRLEGKSISLDAKWDISPQVLMRSITAYREMELEYQSDLDRTSLSQTALFLHQYQKNFSQELLFSGETESRLSWLSGLYYYHSEAGNPFWSVIAGDAPNGPRISSFTSKVDTTSYAGFGDLTWSATDQLHVTLGARYTSETKAFDYRRLMGVPLEIHRKKTWKSPTYRGIVRYDLTPDANVYLSLSNGFKSGVYDAYSNLGVPVAPEKIDAIEVGAKARLNDITFTAAAYNYDYKDIQVQSFATLQGVVVLSLTNAAEAKMRGLEFTADGPLTEHLSFSAGFNWQPTAKFVDFRTAQVTLPIPGATGPVLGQVVQPYDASGSRIPRTPKWTGNVRLNYAAPLWGGSFSGTVSAFHSPGFNWQAGGLTPESAYSIVGTRLSWTDPSERFTYSLWGTNLTDETYSIYTVPNVRGDSETFVQGRQVGLGFAMKL